MTNTTQTPAGKPGALYFECASCAENNLADEGCAWDRDQIRVAPDGTWVCEVCYDDAPRWTYADRPAAGDETEQPEWWELPMPPDYVASAELIRELLDALLTTAGNIRSLGPAGALQPYTEYREWLAVVEAAIAKAEGRSDG